MGGEPSLDSIYISMLLALCLPIGFVGTALIFSRLVLACAESRGFDRDLVFNTLQDIVVKSFVWFSLFSFPILSAR